MALFKVKGRTIPDNLPKKYGNINSNITSIVGNAAGGSGGSKAYFAGGATNTNPTQDSQLISTIYGLDGLTQFTPTALSVARYNMAVADTRIDDGYILFAGGQTSVQTPAATDIVDAYKVDTGTRTTVTLSQAKRGMMGKGLTHGSNYLFFGGETYDSQYNVWQKQSYLEIFDDTLTRTIYGSFVYHHGDYMSLARLYYLWGDNNDKWSDDIKGLYIGTNGGNNTMYYITAGVLSNSGSLVIHTYPLELTGILTDDTGASSLNFDVNNGYYLYAGGVNTNNNNVVNTVRIYDYHFTQLSNQLLAVARRGSMGVELDTACMFVGGQDSNGVVSNMIDVFDKYLTRSNKLSLTNAVYRPSVATTYDSANSRYLGLVNDENTLNYSTIEVFYQNKELDFSINT